jgi:hypothetical protein
MLGSLGKPTAPGKHPESVSGFWGIQPEHLVIIVESEPTDEHAVVAQVASHVNAWFCPLVGV